MQVFFAKKLSLSLQFSKNYTQILFSILYFSSKIEIYKSSLGLHWSFVVGYLVFIAWNDGFVFMCTFTTKNWNFLVFLELSKFSFVFWFEIFVFSTLKHHASWRYKLSDKAVQFVRGIRLGVAFGILPAMFFYWSVLTFSWLQKNRVILSSESFYSNTQME